MERVTFLIEDQGERIVCLLNPESFLWRREAGIAVRPERGGAIAGQGLSDDPVRFTGGGLTLIDLELLFDAELAERPVQVQDVRELTRPLWNLAENGDANGRYAEPPRVRLLWGKSWNVLGVVRSIAERFDRFSADGAPQRSWLKLRFQRINEQPSERLPTQDALQKPDWLDVLEPPAAADGQVASAPVTIATGSGAEGPVRADEIAAQELGSPALWKLIAYANDLVDPLRIAAGTLLRIPKAEGRRAP